MYKFLLNLLIKRDLNIIFCFTLNILFYSDKFFSFYKKKHKIDFFNILLLLYHGCYGR